jgi:hypothetical protein
MSTNNNQKNKRELIQKGKTRIQALKDRIDIAFETLRNIYDESKLEKINQRKDKKQKTNASKTIQYDLEEVANQIVSKEGEVNMKTLQIKGNDNNSEVAESSENAVGVEVVNPFVRRMQVVINELNQSKVKLEIDEGELNKEVASLPKRGLIELSLSKHLLYKKHEKMINSDNEKNNYVKKLENEIVNQRLSLEDLKKAESEHLLQISTLEDQIRILKSKVFGYDIAKKYEYYKEHESANGPSAHIQDDNLAFSMWEKENYGEKINPSRLNKLENEKQMWISNAQNNINKLENDVKLANSYKGGRNFAMNNDEDNGLWTKTPEEARNKNKNNGFNNYGNRYNRNSGNPQGENSLGNMRRITPMIMNNKNNY